MNQQSKEKTFWDWFKDNEDKIFEFEKDQEKIFNELVRELQKVHKNLAFVFSSVKDGKREFIISAGGMKDAFSNVNLLVKEAPKLSRWKFLAFRPRIELPGNITLGGVELIVDDIYFLHELNGKKINVEFYSKQLDEKNQQIFGALFILLDALIGEYDVL